MPVKFRPILVIVYFLFITILFFLPGSAFPKQNWLDKIWFDKWVHVGLFFILCYGACWAGYKKGKNRGLQIFLFAIIYGLIVELIQDQFIPNRSFDIGDWLADAAGSIAGIWLWKRKERGSI